MAYFSNSSDGEKLYRQCEECFYDMDTEQETHSCPVHAVHLMYNYDQCDRGQEKLRGALNILVNEHGECQVKPLVDKIRDCKREDKNQLKLFEVTP